MTRPEVSRDVGLGDITSDKPAAAPGEASKAGGLTVADIMRQIREGNLEVPPPKPPSPKRGDIKFIFGLSNKSLQDSSLAWLFF